MKKIIIPFLLISTQVCAQYYGHGSSDISAIQDSIGWKLEGTNLSLVSDNYVVEIANGSILKPALVFGSDLDTGLFLESPNVLGFVSGGIEVARLESVENGVNCFLFTPSGAGLPPRFGVAGSDANIDIILDPKGSGIVEISSKVKITGGAPGVGKVLTSDADGLGSWTLPAGGGFTDVGATIILTNINDEVGIGESSPDSKLHVTNGGSAGTVTAAVNTITTFESPGNGYLSILTPNSNERGIFFGEPSSNIAGGIIYNSSDTPDGFQFRTVNNVVRMVIEGSGGRVGIGTESPNAQLDVHGTPGASVGGFASGQFHATNPSTTQFANSVITGHNLFSTNTQLWYFGSTSSSNNNISFINRQTGSLSFNTSNISRVIIESDGTVVINESTVIGTGAPAASAILTLFSTTQGLLPPRMTTAQIDAIDSPANSLVAFDTDEDRLRLREGSKWRYISSGRIEGQFSGLNDQAPSTTTPIVLTFEANDIPLFGISHSTSVNPGQFTATIARTFTWQLAPQWEKTTAAGTDTLDFFVQLDTGGGFATITNSNVKVISGEVESNVIFLSISIPMNVDDIVRFMFRSSNPPNLQTTVFPAAGTVALTPSQILNVF